MADTPPPTPAEPSGKAPVIGLWPSQEDAANKPQKPIGCDAIVFYHTCGCRKGDRPIYLCRTNDCKHEMSNLLVGGLPYACRQPERSGACEIKDRAEVEFVREIDTADRLESFLILTKCTKADIDTITPSSTGSDYETWDEEICSHYDRIQVLTRLKLTSRAPLDVRTSIDMEEVRTKLRAQSEIELSREGLNESNGSDVERNGDRSIEIVDAGCDSNEDGESAVGIDGEVESKNDAEIDSSNSQGEADNENNVENGVESDVVDNGESEIGSDGGVVVETDIEGNSESDVTSDSVNVIESGIQSNVKQSSSGTDSEIDGESDAESNDTSKVEGDVESDIESDIKSVSKTYGESDTESTFDSLEVSNVDYGIDNSDEIQLGRVNQDEREDTLSTAGIVDTSSDYLEDIFSDSDAMSDDLIDFLLVDENKPKETKKRSGMGKVWSYFRIL
ncbi:hypothetical protein F4677DRAFT_228175 [Hypoxylon crocopeplum]|nr:hypothetical protein F4677DRAFT_228175 [Hypoxylon crocopeplum]